ncbi:MAG TPA: alpha/beta hydrolase [Actinotalea caeni]|uniref:esterase/lipase family protein n=1 Tax=Actinotalea caeni TaxID=1348467 RepID=UPI002B4AFBCB|nr:alpha/beta hydrolase [Actinotalea caeni]HLV56461.1 alpha/beta hydrolase [Actinotalea caeni]
MTGPLELVLRGCAWAADYAFVARWQLRSLVRRRPAWTQHRPDAREVPAVLLPGIFESWRFLEPLGERLAAAGHPVHVVSLGLNSRPVPALARRVAAAVAAAEVDRAVLVAHSKGGLIGKQLMLDELRASRRGGPAPRIAGMVAVNTPFGGSRYASLVPLASVRAMRPTALRALSSQRDVDARITSVYASWDPHVPEGSELVGATNVRVPHRGHFRVLGLRRVQDAVLRGVARTAAQQPR